MPDSARADQGAAFSRTAPVVERLLKLLDRPGRHHLAGAPEGHDARLLGELAAAAGRPILHVVHDRRRMARMEMALAFFAPGLEVLAIPEWDCMPYDRLSPSPQVVADRMEDLSRFAVEGENQPGRLVLVTVAGLLQRVPPRAALAASQFRAEAGRPVAADELRMALIRAGYIATRGVHDRGEFADTADGIEVFPPHEDRPLRLSLAGGVLGSVRPFDPDSGAAAGEERSELLVRPTAEVWLDADSIERFRRNYLAAFGPQAEDDALFRAVSAGRRHPGLEQWLPMFHDHTETLLDYLPGAPVVLDPGVDERRDARLAQIDAAHAGRRSMLRLDRDVQAYRPLDPHDLFLDAGDWAAALDGRGVITLARAAGRGVEGGGRRLPMPKGEPAEWLQRLRGEGRRVVVCVGRAGREAAVARKLRRLGVKPTALARDAGTLGRLAPETVGVAAIDLVEPVAAPDLALIPAPLLVEEGRPRPRRRLPAFPGLGGLAIGGAVVHEEHGVGICDGLEVVEAAGVPHDCVRLLYGGGAKLFVPVENMDQLWNYGAEDKRPQLDSLRSDAWPARRDAVAQEVVPAVRTLVAQAADRARKQVPPLRPPAEYDDMAERFPFELTDGQRAAVEAVLGDLGSGRLMDRLVCGDVGFGKTEVAIRAAFVAALAGRQVAVVVPTTPLARQHHDGFRRRFAGFGIEIAQLSRAVPAAEARAVRQGLGDGGVRLVVGTHALLAPSIDFADLGLVVIDEEQRLGVRQKERLKALSETVHVLTMTATPIPRTLQLALCGLRDLSVIDTPPVARKPVRSLAMADDPATIRDALRRECDRGGQSFYVCPRLADIEPLRRRLRELVPDLDVAVAHGRLPPAELDEVVGGFADGRWDVLLCTNIVETGLDIPNANTLIVHRAEMFGLAQLHQLRGRVGRSTRRGHAFFTHDPAKALSQEARRRLEALVTVTDPGAGFVLASRDMDIRGSGDLLGEEQSGHMREVGAELFHQMLRNAVAAAAGDEGAAMHPVWSPRLQLGLPVLIPADYIRDPAQRLAVYRRIATLEDEDEGDALIAELASRFGPPPEAVETMVSLGEIKRLCRMLAVAELEAGPRGALLRFRDGPPPPDTPLARAFAAMDGVVPKEDGAVLVRGDWPDPDSRLAGLRRLLDRLARKIG